MSGSTGECDHHGDHQKSNYQMAGDCVLQLTLDNINDRLMKMILVEVNIQCV